MTHQSRSSLSEKELKKKTIYPKGEYIFRCFNTTPFSKVKVVIVGQDPYFNEKQANGLCFSVNKGVKIPPSLLNIFKEIILTDKINRVENTN